MHEFPHHYHVDAEAEAEGNVLVSVENLPTLHCAPPAEFDGPGDQWSPEHLLTASVANCFILTFRAVARASGLEWTALECDVDGVLDRVDRVTRFTALELRVTLDVPEGVGESKALRLLEKAEHACLITNSMTAEVRLDATVREAAPA